MGGDATTRVGESPEARPRVNLESVTRTAAFVAIVSYATGLVVVNTYLQQVGVSDFELLRPRFVTTGLLFLLMLAVGAGCPALIVALWSRPEGQKSARVRRGIVLVGLLAAPLALFVALTLGDLGGSVAFYVVTAFVGVAALRPWITGRAWWTRILVLMRGPNHPTDVINSAVGLVVLVMSGTLVLVFFSRATYPYIPEQWGGGKPYYARFIVTDEAAAELPKFFVKARGNITRPVRLLFQGSDFYVLDPWEGDMKSVVLSRDDVLAMSVGDDSFELHGPPTPEPPAPTPESSAPGT
jgi:hypothetical protein